MIFDNGSPPEAPSIRLVAFGRRDGEGRLLLERDVDAPPWLET